MGAQQLIFFSPMQIHLAMSPLTNREPHKCIRLKRSLAIFRAHDFPDATWERSEPSN